MPQIGFTEKQAEVFRRFNALRRAYEDANGGGRVYNPDFLTVLMDAWEVVNRLETVMELDGTKPVSLRAYIADAEANDPELIANRMKYRVKIPCYHYNTGSADNYNYVAKHDFETKDDADSFAKKVNEQYEMHSKFEKHEIAFSVYNNWSEKLKHTGEMYEVEDGCITGFAMVVEFLPEQENETE